MTKPTLTLIEFPAAAGLPRHESFSPFCIKVHRALKVLGLPYTSAPITSPGDMRRVNPKRQLPVLMVGDERVIDSTDIVTRLEAIAGRSLAGSTPRMAAEARLWEEFADGALYGFVVSARWADDDNWPRVRDAYFAGLPWPVRNLLADRVRARVVATLIGRDVWRGGPVECWSRLEVLLDDLDVRAPETGFFLGAELTRADIALFAQLHSFRTRFTPVQADMVARRPRLVAWLDRVDEATRGVAHAEPTDVTRGAGTAPMSLAS